MRLSQILATWPRKRPNGHIWTGKHRMVLKVREQDIKTMDRQIKMEVANTHLCLNPFITPEQENIAMKAREQNSPRPDQVLFRLRKKKIESTVMAPTYAEDNFKQLVRNVSWEV